MAIIANLTPEQQIVLEKTLIGFKATNSDLLFEFFNHDKEIKPIQETADTKTLEEKVDALNRKLDLIFGNHIFIDGKLTCVGNFNL